MVRAQTGAGAADGVPWGAVHGLPQHDHPPAGYGGCGAGAGKEAWQRGQGDSAESGAVHPAAELYIIMYITISE